MRLHRIIFSAAALTAAIAVGLLSFFQREDITANYLILVAQFLLYSLTMAGFGEFVAAILRLFKQYSPDETISALHSRGTDEDLDKKE